MIAQLSAAIALAATPQAGPDDEASTDSFGARAESACLAADQPPEFCDCRREAVTETLSDDRDAAIAYLGYLGDEDAAAENESWEDPQRYQEAMRRAYAAEAASQACWQAKSGGQ